MGGAKTLDNHASINIDISVGVVLVLGVYAQNSGFALMAYKNGSFCFLKNDNALTASVSGNTLTINNPSASNFRLLVIG